MGLQAESIASLKGVAYEHKTIRETYALHRHDILVCNKAYFKFGIVRHPCPAAAAHTKQHSTPHSTVN
jgi:hypothetical protein